MNKRIQTSVALTVVVAACATVFPRADAPIAQAARRADAGTLTIGQTQAFSTTFIPDMSATTYTGNISRFAFDELLKLDNHLKYIPGIAEKWSWSKDHKTVTMTIRKDAVWSDGQPITSDDVLLFMNFLASPEYNGPLAGQFESYVDPVVGAQDIVKGTAKSFADTGGFKKINDKVFQLNFTKVDAAVLFSDVSGYEPLPAHILGKMAFKDWFTSSFNRLPTVASGPYIFSQVNGTDSVEMVANKKYWAGAPKIDKVVWKTANTDVAPGLLASGKIDLQFSLKAKDIDNLKQTPGLKVKEMPALSLFLLGLKETIPEFKDYRVREAVEYALDRQAMVTGILKGHGQVINGPLPPVSWAAASTKDGLNPYNYSPAKANKLFDQAGWQMRNGWRIDPTTGKTADLHLAYWSGDTQASAAVTAIQQYLAKVGVKVTVDPPTDFNALVPKLEKDDKSIQMYLIGYGLGVDPDPRFFWASDASLNLDRWIDKHNDALIAKTFSESAFDQQARRKTLISWQLYVNKQMPENFLWTSNSVYAYNQRLHIPASDWAPTGPINVQDWTVGQ